MALASYFVLTLMAMTFLVGLAFVFFGDGVAILSETSIHEMLAKEIPSFKDEVILISHDQRSALVKAATREEQLIVVVVVAHGKKLVTRRLHGRDISKLGVSNASLIIRQPDSTLPLISMKFANHDQAGQAITMLRDVAEVSHAPS